jgi:GrpB-like predicted nucleotidyltransferase (UPF0157 family)
MTEEESLQQAIREQVRIFSYDPKWPEKYEVERGRLVALFPEAFLAIEHVGSTAVPGMAAKPIVDMIGGVGSMEEADALLPALCQNGYSTSAEFNATLTDQRWLMRHANGHRTHHLHLIIHEAIEWRRKITFRNALRANPDVARRYQELKANLAKAMGSDREAYTSAKAEFVEEIVRGTVES